MSYVGKSGAEIRRGAIYPIDGFPDWMRSIAVVNPEAYAVHALLLLMYNGASLAAVLGTSSS
jgi:hypothetical protein